MLFASTYRSKRRSARIGTGLAGALSLAALAIAGPAHAGGGFEDAFEAELGRIAAHHVAAVGSLVLFGPPREVTVVRHVRHARPHRHFRGCGHAPQRHGHARPHRGHGHHHAHPGHRHGERHDLRHRGERRDRHDQRAGHRGRRGGTVKRVEITRKKVVIRDGPRGRDRRNGRHLAHRH